MYKLKNALASDHPRRETYRRLAELVPKPNGVYAMNNFEMPEYVLDAALTDGAMFFTSRETVMYQSMRNKVFTFLIFVYNC